MSNMPSDGRRPPEPADYTDEEIADAVRAHMEAESEESAADFVTRIMKLAPIVDAWANEYWQEIADIIEDERANRVDDDPPDPRNSIDDEYINVWYPGTTYVLIPYPGEGEQHG